MRHFILLLMTLGTTISYSNEKLTIPLWPGEEPYSTGENVTETIDDKGHIRNVARAEMHVYFPDSANSSETAMLICPGGGYEFLSWKYEGEEVARFLNSLGVTAVVLKYRLPVQKNVFDAFWVPLVDAERAMRKIRGNADEWGINPAKVGVIGFSAGGHLASCLATIYGEKGLLNDEISKMNASPDFAALIYPVIDLGLYENNNATKENLLSKLPRKKETEQFSTHLWINQNTCPVFLAHASDDPVVSPLHSLKFYEILLENDVKAEMRIYQSGGHGFGVNRTTGSARDWAGDLAAWLKFNGWIK